MHQLVSYVTVISVYAPTHRAEAVKKEEFFDTLQTTIDTVPEEDVMVILGDWNARVGSSVRTDDGTKWDGV